MCAINPKHQIHFKLSIYTTVEMSEDEFNKLVMERVFNTEQLQNADGRLRWHFTDLAVKP